MVAFLLLLSIYDVMQITFSNWFLCAWSVISDFIVSFCTKIQASFTRDGLPCKYLRMISRHLFSQFLWRVFLFGIYYYTTGY